LRRGAVGLAARFAPALTARWAERVFLTPGRRTPSAAERAALATGYRFSVPFAATRLAAWSWGDGPTVFLVHGWGGSAARMTSFVGPLLAAGYSVVAFDGPGHGASDGSTSSVVEMALALRAVTEWTAAADAVRGHPAAIGHSIGGAAIALAASQGVPFRRMAFIGTPADLESPSRSFATGLGLPPEVVSRMQARIERRFGIRWRDLAVPRLAPSAPAPLLVVHDRQDAAVPATEAERIAQSWPGSQQLTTTGLGHHRILHDPGVVRAVVEFVAGPRERRRRGSGRHSGEFGREAVPVG
jgi:pimeloyl-ACP methyl ester carboxylesterase